MRLCPTRTRSFCSSCGKTFCPTNFPVKNFRRVPHIVAYKAGNVLAGIDLVSGFFHVESEEIREAQKVYDDLFVFRGLDERDLENYFLVSEYIRLKKK